jgi:hypothetical protein
MTAGTLARGLALLAALGVVGCGSSSDGSDSRLESGQTLTLPSDDGHAVAHLDAEGGIVEGKNVLHVAFEPASTELVGASALMPVHGHGFNKPPTIEKADDGYRMSDVVFYMSGLWNVVLDVKVADIDDKIEFTIDVP